MKKVNQKAFFIVLGFISLGFLSSIIFYYGEEVPNSSEVNLSIITVLFATLTAFAMAFKPNKKAK